ncbi:hypothetical protein ACWEPU_42475, partial [Nocardia brasiliensis]
PRDKMRITDIGGAGKSVFVLPMWDGTIYLNLGSAGFDNPRTLGMTSYNKKQKRNNIKGEVFIHELVHAWQIHHTSFDLSYLGRALVARLDEVGGGDPYDYAAAGLEYQAYSLEGQAEIISDWYGNHARYTNPGDRLPTGLDGEAALNDPYYRYVADHIRIGKY